MNESYEASVAIFHNQRDFEAQVSKPLVPSQVFKKAQEIIEAKQGCAIVETRSGTYVIRYSETGPFKEKVSSEWMPVQIIRLKQWHSGGIKQVEMNDYVTSLINEHE